MEEKKRAARQAAIGDGVSSIATSSWISSDSTIATMVRAHKDALSLSRV
jgi:hypothetical protein